MDIRTEPSHSFDPDDQIQPCSIDLRLSPVYWRARKIPRPVDLGRSKLLEVSPRRNWKRLELGSGESITLKPGEMVLGRIYEQLTIPHDCAGAIEGRSSFARMGLSVHCTGGFINPGWRGHMPLSLVNNGRTQLRLPAYVSICQLMLIPLTGKPSRVYGNESLHSKYVNDDGGPSYWWRDRAVTRLLGGLGSADVRPDLQARLLQRIGVPSDEILERLEHLVATRPVDAFANVDELLTEFARKEGRRKRQDMILRRAAIGSFPVMLAATLGSLFVRPISILHYVIWGLTVLAALLSLLGFKTEPGEYLGPKELAELDRRLVDER